MLGLYILYAKEREMFAVINGKVILDNEINQKVIIVDGQRIKEITDRVPDDIEAVDAEGYYVSPGFINIHVHGYNGNDAMDGSFKTGPIAVLNTVICKLGAPNNSCDPTFYYCSKLSYSISSKYVF